MSLTFTAVPTWAWITAGGALAGFLWLREHDAKLRAEGRAEAQAEVIDSLRSVADSALAEVAQLDSAVNVQKVVIQHQRDQFDAMAAAARQQTRTAVASLRETLDSTQRVMLDNIETSYEKQLAAKDSMYAAQVRLTLLAESQVASRDSALTKIQQASSVVYDAWQIEKKRASPGIVTKAIRALPVAAAAVIVTLVATAD